MISVQPHAAKSRVRLNLFHPEQVYVWFHSDLVYWWLTISGMNSLCYIVHGNVSSPLDEPHIRCRLIVSPLHSLNTRRIVRGAGTDKQGTSNPTGGVNHTNMFHLGTRIPSLGPTDMDGWEAAYTPSSAALTSRVCPRF